MKCLCVSGSSAFLIYPFFPVPPFSTRENCVCFPSGCSIFVLLRNHDYAIQTEKFCLILGRSFAFFHLVFQANVLKYQHSLGSEKIKDDTYATMFCVS